MWSKMCIGYHTNYPLFLSDFNKPWIIWTVFRKVFTCLLNPWSRVLLEKLTGSAASQEIPRIFGTRKFITILTNTRHLSLSWANSIQSPQAPSTAWRSISVLSCLLRLGLPSGLLTSGFPHQNLVHPSPLPHTRHMPRPSHSSLRKVLKYQISWKSDKWTPSFMSTDGQTEIRRIQ